VEKSSETPPWSLNLIHRKLFMVLSAGQGSGFAEWICAAGVKSKEE
jgi:hypothetical protein